MWNVMERWWLPFSAVVEGTLLLNGPCRLLGYRLGANVLQVSFFRTCDFDLVDVGANSVCTDPHFQLHTFEDRVFWAEKSKIGRNCVIGPHACIMGGILKPKSTIAEHCGAS
jgi:hypothetical protein